MQTHDTKLNGYRPDIDGLRCIAVLSVLFYHAGIRFFSGGFVGVDIFFVISGYLITSKLRSDLELGRFSFKQFYLGRIRRLAPAYIGVAIFALLGSWILLIPLDFKYFAASLAASFASISNIFFSLLSGGYFDSRMSDFPLLHTWSLSVEEQFYLLWCPILFLLRKTRYFVQILIAGAIASLLISQYLTQKGLPSGYFGLHSRAFELLVGALCTVGVVHVERLQSFLLKQFITIIGLILVIGSILLLHKTDPFPGVYALPAVFGTAFLICVGNSIGILTNTLLSWRPLVFIGLISYSLYLWHWPVLVFIKYRQIELSGLVIAIYIFGCLTIASASWQFVEKPFRTGYLFTFRRTALQFFFLPIAITSAIFIMSQLTNGLPQRFPVDVNRMISSYSQGIDLGKTCSWGQLDTGSMGVEYLNKNCRIGADVGSPQFVLYGDSHAHHVKGFFDAMAKASQVAGVYHVQGGCSPVDGMEPVTDRDANRLACYQHNKDLLGTAGAYRYVILASKWSARSELPGFEDRIIGIIKAIRNSGAIPIVVMEVPNTEKDLSRCQLYVDRRWISDKTDCTLFEVDVKLVQQKQNTVFEFLKNSYPDVIFVDPKLILCKESKCATAIAGLAVYRDKNHLNSIASELLGKEYFTKYGNIFK
jgi:peptidoglycan/LPS O-acetylase OafA/YrhL